MRLHLRLLAKKSAASTTADATLGIPAAARAGSLSTNLGVSILLLDMLGSLHTGSTPLSADRRPAHDGEELPRAV